VSTLVKDLWRPASILGTAPAAGIQDAAVHLRPQELIHIIDVRQTVRACCGQKKYLSQITSRGSLCCSSARSVKPPIPFSAKLTVAACRM